MKGKGEWSRRRWQRGRGRSSSEDFSLREWEQTGPEAEDVCFRWGNLLWTFDLLPVAMGA